MLVVDKYNAHGQLERHDLHALPLPNGTLAHKLSQAELFRALSALGVADVSVSEGMQSLLVKFARHLAANRRDPITGKFPGEAA